MNGLLRHLLRSTEAAAGVDLSFVFDLNRDAEVEIITVFLRMFEMSRVGSHFTVFS